LRDCNVFVELPICIFFYPPYLYVFHDWEMKVTQSSFVDTSRKTGILTQTFNDLAYVREHIFGSQKYTSTKSWPGENSHLHIILFSKWYTKTSQSFYLDYSVMIWLWLVNASGWVPPSPVFSNFLSVKLLPSLFEIILFNNYYYSNCMSVRNEAVKTNKKCKTQNGWRIQNFLSFQSRGFTDVLTYSNRCLS